MVVANDPDADVRSQAAKSLGWFINEPGVRDALRRAAAEDPNDQPRVPCCIPTVRESARLALRADMDPTEAVRSAALDESLTPHERLLFSSPQGMGMRLDAFDADVARAVSFFIHPDAGFITGQSLYVCGGASIGSISL